MASVHARGDSWPRHNLNFSENGLAAGPVVLRHSPHVMRLSQAHELLKIDERAINFSIGATHCDLPSMQVTRQTSSYRATY